MSLRFVKTEILSSTDGLSHGESKKLVADVQSSSSSKTLFQQLEEQKDRQKEAYDAVTKQIFAPPQSLAEDDVAFYEAQAKRDATRDQDQVDAFAAARAAYHPDDRPPKRPSAALACTKKPPDGPKLTKRIRRADEPVAAPVAPSGLGSLLAYYDDDED